MALATYKETSTPSKSDIKSNNIFKIIQEYILNLQDDNLYALQNKNNLAYIQSPDTITKNYIFHQLLSDEYVLSILNISSIIFKDARAYSKDTTWYFCINIL